MVTARGTGGSALRAGSVPPGPPSLGLKRELLQGQCQREEKPAQHFPQPSVVSPGHKIKRLRRNMKRCIDFFFSPAVFFPFFPSSRSRRTPQGAGGTRPGQEMPVWVLQWGSGVMLESFWFFVPPLHQSQTSLPLFEGLWGHSRPCAPNVPVPCGCWRRVTAPILCWGASENAPVPSPPPARSLPDDPRAKLSRLLRVSLLAPAAGAL